MNFFSLVVTLMLALVASAAPTSALSHDATPSLTTRQTTPNLLTTTPTALKNIANYTFSNSITNLSVNDFLHKRDGDWFKIETHNNCGFTKLCVLYEVVQPAGSPWWIRLASDKVNIEPGQFHDFWGYYWDTGLRLSGHASAIISGMPRSSSNMVTVAGVLAAPHTTISMFPGSDGDIGMSVSPYWGGCDTKTCWPWYYPREQCWTDSTIPLKDSWANTVCYAGQPSWFKVTYCP